LTVKRLHPYSWFWEPLADHPNFELRSMFGARAVYLSGRLQLCFTAKEEPWRGILVCTDRSHQPALRAEWPELQPHPVLPKWLYLPEAADAFERVGQALVECVRRGDPRIGVEPGRRRANRGL